jgi:hypothetical protein
MGKYTSVASNFFTHSDVSSPGVIKGSEMTLDSETHFLDYETYLNLSTRTQATFASRRKEIYVLFETYLKMKRDRREYDAADRLGLMSSRPASLDNLFDRTHAILRSMTQDGMKGQRIDFLFAFLLTSRSQSQEFLK